MLIAVDHGNKQIKTVHTPPFTSGLIQSDTPGFGTDALAYAHDPNGKVAEGYKNLTKEVLKLEKQREKNRAGLSR